MIWLSVNFDFLIKNSSLYLSGIFYFCCLWFIGGITARAAEVPILVVYVDSAVRTIGIEGLMEPSEDVDGDIQKLKTFFDGKKGLKPENYAS
jgi:hypothetical protein